MRWSSPATSVGASLNRDLTVVNEVRAFFHQVKAFVRTGKLTEGQGELLLVGARGIIDQP